jgi:hypothetical protein
MNDRFISAIGEMHMVDQNLRQLAAGPEITAENYMVYLADLAHNARIRRLVAKHGHPTAETVGAEALKQFWLLVQHQDSDPDLQEECLEKCGFEPQQNAYLTDRVRVNAGQPQLYGTQLRRTAEGKLAPRPIEDEGRVDERRNGVGLGPLEEYVAKSNE